MPHVTKIIRKPQPVGSEMKSLCDSQSNIMLRLDLMEGRHRQSLKIFGSGGTAQVLRLTQHYFGSWRVVVGDSAFSSYYTATECLNNGLHFMGIVKTAHREFPRDFLMSKTDEYGRGGDKPRGGFVHLKTTHKIENNGHSIEKPVFAHGWYDKKLKQIVSTCGTTLAGTDSVRPRHKKILENGVWKTVQYEKKVPRSKLVEEMFSAFSKIDIHDHLRQGSLALERSWVTRKWYHRLFTTIFGICVVDAYYAFKFEHPDDDMNFTDFWGTLTLQLINNDFLGEAMQMRINNEEEEEQQVTLSCLRSDA